MFPPPKSANAPIEKNRRHHGSVYEEKAKVYFLALGYRFIAQNVTYKFGEIDLIFEDETASRLELVFVEVKKRGSGSFILPEESVTYTKERRLRLAINRYLATYSGRAESVRIDLFAYYQDQPKHFKNFI